MENILFVSAFKDINRKSWKVISKTNEQYFVEFFNLASNIDYNLIVFVNDFISEQLHKKYTFKSNIYFYNIDKINTFYNKFLESQTKIINSKIYQSKIPYDRRDAPEHWCPEYNLINHSKINFVSAAKQIFPTYKFYSWIDFGYVRNNINNVPKNINIDVLPENKIIYQCHTNPPINSINPSLMLSSHIIYFMGSSYIIPNVLVEQFENLYENTIIDLEKQMVVDDDQALILQIYFNNQNLFQYIVNTNWFTLYNNLN
jgi:hypothetical protein